MLTTHTLFCSREPVDDELLLFLCGMFNSFVANYLVRLQVGTHVTAALMARLPVPRPSRPSAAFRLVASCADVLRAGITATPHARLQATAARLYGVSAAQLRHVLDTFPLVSVEERQAVIEEFDAAPAGSY